jgi:hypothetical protein
MRTALLFVSLALTPLFVGCGDATESGTVEVKGVVNLDGQPVDQAAVAFIGNEGARLASAQTDSGGKFTIRAAPGKNVVTVAKASTDPAAPPPTEADMLMPSDEDYVKLQQAKPVFPAKYADPKTSGLSFDVAEGMPELVIDLSSK